MFTGSCSSCACHLAVIRNASTTVSPLEESSTYIDTLSLALNADFFAVSCSAVSAPVGVGATRSLLQVTPLTGNCSGGMTGTCKSHRTLGLCAYHSCRGGQAPQSYLPPSINSKVHRRSCWLSTAAKVLLSLHTPQASRLIML